METKTHWKKTFNKDYLGAHDLDNGKDLVAVVDHVEVREVKDTSGNNSKCNVAVFKGNVKPMILNVTNCKIMKAFAASNYLEDWHDIPIQICIKEVQAFGDTVEALRIRPKQPQMEKQELTPGHDMWSQAVEHLKKPNGKIEDITGRYKVSQENIDKLQEETLL
jgi:hypothetical protein